MEDKQFDGNWIKLHRGLLKSYISSDPHALSLWIHLLLLAQHKPSEFIFNGKLVKLKAGQLLTGRKKLAVNSGISENKIFRLLKVLESEQQIEQQKTNKYTIISITNWHKYQSSEQQIEQQVNNRRTTGKQQVDTYKNDKKIKKEKNDNNINPESPKVDPEYKYFKHDNPEINTDIQVLLKNNEHKSLLTKLSELELRYWINARIEWLITKPKEAKKSTRSDYLAILKWQKLKIEQGFRWDEDTMESHGYFRPWEIENKIKSLDNSFKLKLNRL